MNPILKKIEDGVDRIVSEPGDKEQYDRIVIAGKKVMFDESTSKHISWLQNPSDLAAMVTGIFDLIAILGEMSKGTMKSDPAIGAAVSLAMQALDFAERAQGIPVTQEIADAAVHAVNEKMLEGASQQPSEQPQAEATAQPSLPQGLIQSGI